MPRHRPVTEDMSANGEEKLAAPRSLHGCLPLFMVGSLVCLCTALWLVPIEEKSEPEPAGKGLVYYGCDELFRYEIERTSPLVLLSLPTFLESYYEESHALREITKRKAELRQASPMEILPPVADSAIISRENLLELPPETPAAPEEGAQPAEDSQEVAP